MCLIFLMLKKQNDVNNTTVTISSKFSICISVALLAKCPYANSKQCLCTHAGLYDLPFACKYCNVNKSVYSIFLRCLYCGSERIYDHILTKHTTSLVLT